ncbi:hypothetical protein AGLY_015411 [Aphis glycines]|uniref:SWIM-type domain-containing protein n=1 Tax=Aphis glycines TaxID=307491 RepID=A0A6G0T0K2_APHGL|nr:hypothetical protein AGLY_015411 [Aphis glycines]
MRSTKYNLMLKTKHFLNWKVKYESETCSYFYHRKNERSRRRRVEYWYCNRSGYQSSLQNLNVNNTDDTVQAVVHHTHYGLKAELVHLRIPKSVKIEDILLSYKKDGSSKQTERKHLKKRRDILNIFKKYNVKTMSPEVQLSKNKTNYEPDQDTIKPLIYQANKHYLIASQFSLSPVNPIHESIENVWRISMENSLVSKHSINYNNKPYDVTKNDVLSCSSEDCISYCNYCNICYHVYSCKCQDYTLKKIICKHIHLTVLFQVNSQTCQYKNHIERSFYRIQDHTYCTQNHIEPIKNSQP